MRRAGLALLRLYLELFAFFATNREHARREHALFAGSLHEAYERHRRAVGPLRASARSLRSHLRELEPLALIRKTRADAAYAPGRDAHYLLRVGAGGAAVMLVAAAGFAALGPRDDTEPGPSVVAMALPAGEAQAGAAGAVTEVGSLREGIYIATGGRVCIPEDLGGPDLTDEIVNTPSTPAELEACAHFELPEPALPASSETNPAAVASD